jgi:hypothetical protein
MAMLLLMNLVADVKSNSRRYVFIYKENVLVMNLMMPLFSLFNFMHISSIIYLFYTSTKEPQLATVTGPYSSVSFDKSINDSMTVFLSSYKS